jgi:hypothetical protein
MDRLGRPRAAGISVWLDMLSRDLLESGRFERLQAKRAVTGATSNPKAPASVTLAAAGDRGADLSSPGREVVLDPESWPAHAEPGSSTHDQVERERDAQRAPPRCRRGR